MDLLNDQYPLFNEDTLDDNNSDESSDYLEKKNIATEIQKLIKSKSNKFLKFDEWNIIYSDELWYLWCTVQETISINNSPFLDRIEYTAFCNWIYKNSSKK